MWMPQAAFVHAGHHRAARDAAVLPAVHHARPARFRGEILRSQGAAVRPDDSGRPQWPTEHHRGLRAVCHVQGHRDEAHGRRAGSPPNASRRATRPQGPCPTARSAASPCAGGGRPRAISGVAPPFPTAEAPGRYKSRNRSNPIVNAVSTVNSRLQSHTDMGHIVVRQDAAEFERIRCTFPTASARPSTGLCSCPISSRRAASIGAPCDRYNTGRVASQHAQTSSALNVPQSYALVIGAGKSEPLIWASLFPRVPCLTG